MGPSGMMPTAACELGVEPVVPPRYTGKERDSESGNDYFGARYYASSMGRFLSPDWSAKVVPVPYAKLDNPQSLNLYAYVGNNPLRAVDPDGHEVAASCAKDKNCQITVKVNVIYDKTANNGKGLSKDQKSAFEKDYLGKAQKDFGNSNIKLQYSYTAGSYTQDDSGKINVTGVKSDSLNVVVSSASPNGKDGVSTAANGMAFTFLVPSISNKSNFMLDSNTFEHELGHQFLGDAFNARDLGNNFSRDVEIDSRNTFQGLGVSQSGYREGLEPRTYASGPEQ